VPAHQTVQYFSAAFYSNRARGAAYMQDATQKVKNMIGQYGTTQMSLRFKRRLIQVKNCRLFFKREHIKS
jgi:ribosomal protein S17E